MKSNLKPYTVIEATVRAFEYVKGPPFVKPHETKCLRDKQILVLEPNGEWYPPGDETWSITDEYFHEWITSFDILAIPPERIDNE